MIQLFDWLTLAGHFAIMSLFAVGGAIVLIPDFHRFLVMEHGWLSETDFSSGIALAQASPGPNALMLGMMGWGFGLNATPLGQVPILFAITGFYLCLICVLTPSSVLVYRSTKWLQKNNQKRSVIAFKKGLAPVGVGSMLVSSWLIVRGDMVLAHNFPTWLLSLVTLVLVWKTNLHILWLLALGAAVGASGLLLS
jgi:chromate transporter